jgi:hypothetical protein
MTPPQPGPRDSAGSNDAQQPIPHPACLPELRDRRTRLSAVLEEIEVRPDSLDSQASHVHDQFVMGVYELMRTEVAQACGSRWDIRDRRRLRDTYHAAANKWPTYREALVELEGVRGQGRTVVDAMGRLEGPRSGYIYALLNFYDEFSATLDVFFSA